MGGRPRVSTQPCRGRGEGGVRMLGQRQRGGGTQKSGWGRLGEPPGDLLCRLTETSVGSVPGSAWGGCQPRPARPWRALLLSDGISSGLCVFQVQWRLT